MKILFTLQSFYYFVAVSFIPTALVLIIVNDDTISMMSMTRLTHQTNGGMVHGFQRNVIPQRRQLPVLQQNQMVLNRIYHDSNCEARKSAVSAAGRYQYQRTHPYQNYGTTPTTTQLYYYNNNNQRHDRCMSKITEAKNQERIRKKHADQKAGKYQKKEKKEPYEWLPFWTTPERDPYDSIYIQDPIAEKDCKPLRLYIPAESDMLEVGSMCAMLFLTTPDLDTYLSLPNNGDVIFLKGDLGSGKSVFARGFVRGALGNWNLEVPSPTYLLSNTYFASEDHGSNKNLEIHHMDLYRLAEHANQQYFMLNLNHVFKNCLSLIEWPERLPADLVPEERLELSIEYASLAKRDGTIDMENTKQFRILTFTPYGILWRRRVYDIRYLSYVEDLKMKEKDEFNPNNPQE